VQKWRNDGEKKTGGKTRHKIAYYIIEGYRIFFVIFGLMHIIFPKVLKELLFAIFSIFYITIYQRKFI